MILSAELISGLVAGVEIFWDSEEDPLRGFVLHFVIFRFMVLWIKDTNE